MKCLVTGGEGFIGSHVVEKLLVNNHDVIVIDNESSKVNQNFFKIDHPSVAYFNENICDQRTHRLYYGVDWVFHLAARSRIQLSIDDPTDTFVNNVLGTQSVLEASRYYNVKKVIYSSTSSVYGLRNKPPHLELMDVDCLNPYSLSKYQGEQICNLYNSLWNVGFVCLRYFNVYGPREPHKGEYASVSGIFKRQKQEGIPLTIVGDGEQRRDFTYVGDVANANLLAATSLDIRSGVFNIGAGNNYSVNDLADAIGGPHVHIPERKAEVRETLACNNRAYYYLGWKPTKDFIDYVTNES